MGDANTPESSEIVGTSLAERGKQGQAVFATLSPKETGVKFISPILADHPMRFLYASGMACGGVAVGDVDNDGRPDIYMAGQPFGNKLFRQTGELKFEDVTETAGVNGGDNWSRGVSMFDIDGDNDLDIYVCVYDAPNLLYVNQGDGTFTQESEERGTNIVDSSHTAAICDYDSDGDLDIYVMTNRYYNPQGKPPVVHGVAPNGEVYILPQHKKYYRITKIRRNRRERTVTVTTDAYGRDDFLLQNDGQGHFKDVTSAAGIGGGGRGLSATWFDYDHDGWSDLYVGNDFDDPDRLYRNNGDGTFTDVIREMTPYTTWFSMGADFADLNDDGMFDFVIADMSGTTHYRQKTSMGAMSVNQEFLATAVPRQYMRNVVYINSGGGRFLEAGYLTGLDSTDWTWSVKLNDWDNDGRVDVFFSNGTSRNFNESDNPASLDHRPNETEWDRHERAGTPPLKQENMAFRNLGDLRFEEVGRRWGLDHAGMSFGSATGDLDRDGDLDLVIVNLGEEVSICRNDSQQGNRLLVQLKGTRSNSQGIGAIVKVNSARGAQIRQIIPTRGYMASDEAIAHFGLGDDERIERLTVQWPSGHVQTFEDLTANHLYTITEPNKEPPPRQAPKPVPAMFARTDALANVRHRESTFDDFARQPLLPNKHSQLGPALAWGDANGDGRDDVYLGGASGQAGRLLVRGDGDVFQPLDGPWNKDIRQEDMGAIWIDADSDGDQDLYVVSGGVECNPGDEVLQDRLYINEGNEGFRLAQDALPKMRTSGSVVAAADYDRDGDLDLFVGGRVIPGDYPLAPSSYLLQNDAGKFSDITDTIAPQLRKTGLVTSAVWSDADGDGWIDLLVTHEWGPVKLYRNETNRGKGLVDESKSAGLADLLGWWNGIAAGDVDNDGDIDYAITNFGLNTKYHASVEKPALLYYGDFEGNGRMRLVEAEFEDKTLFPVRGRSCSTNAMPTLGNKYTTFHDFALASVEEIYTPVCLSKAHKFACTELRTGALINDGEGRFRFRPLPRIAQIAPGFGVALVDVNADGNVDLCIAQNFFTPQLETGRMSGGVSMLLLGDGRGEFAPVWPNRSGIVVGTDAKSLTVTDLNNDRRPDLVFGINDDHVVAYTNEIACDVRRLLNVRLRGKPGNPAAVGAKVTVVGESGRSAVAESYSASGYLSQSTPTLFLTFANRPREIKVSWPNGQSSVHQIHSDGKQRMTIEQP